MNKNIKRIVLTKTFLYVSTCVGVGEMLTSSDGIAAKMFAIACLISLTIDLQTW